jgi:hypothetical protein
VPREMSNSFGALVQSIEPQTTTPNGRETAGLNFPIHAIVRCSTASVGLHRIRALDIRLPLVLLQYFACGNHALKPPAVLSCVNLEHVLYIQPQLGPFKLPPPISCPSAHRSSTSARR